MIDLTGFEVARIAATISACAVLVVSNFHRIITTQGQAPAGYAIGLVAATVGAGLVILGELMLQSKPWHYSLALIGGAMLVWFRHGEHQQVSRSGGLVFAATGMCALAIVAGLQYAERIRVAGPPVAFHKITPKVADGEFAVEFQYTRFKVCSAIARWQIITTNPHRVVWEAEYQAGGTRAKPGRQTIIVPSRPPQPVIEPGRYRFAYFRTDHCPEGDYEHEPVFVPFEVASETQ